MGEISRRTLAKGIAWATPAIAVAALVPEAAASACLNPHDPMRSFTVMTPRVSCTGGTWFDVMVTLNCPGCTVTPSKPATVERVPVFSGLASQTPTSFTYRCRIDPTTLDSVRVYVQPDVTCGATVYRNVFLIFEVYLC